MADAEKGASDAKPPAPGVQIERRTIEPTEVCSCQVYLCLRPSADPMCSVLMTEASTKLSDQQALARRELQADRNYLCGRE